MRIAFFRLALIGLALAAATPAMAWTRPGHMVSAAIAYDELMASDPDVVRQVLAIIAAHPDRGPFEVAVGRDNGEARNRNLFLEIARWPDDIRGGIWDHPTWHYFARPVIDQAAPPPATAKPSAHGEAYEAFALNVAVARDPLAPIADRAVALCWIFHILGDIHQPFHNAERFGAAWPDGDSLGAKVFVKDPETGEPIALHWLWDDSINRSPATADAFRKARELVAHYPRADFARQLDSARTIEQWSDESYGLARTLAYREDAPRTSDKAAAGPAAESYLRDMAPAAQARLTLAGYRLADLLRVIFGTAAPRKAM